MKEPTLKQLKKAAPRAKVLRAEADADREHELELLEPGTHGPDSLTARCSCLLYSVTAAGPARDALRARAPREHALHIRETRADAEERDRNLRLFQKDTPSKYDRDPRNVKMPGGSRGAAAPRKSLRDPPFPVEYVHVDGFSCVMPRGYSRAHADAERARQNPPPLAADPTEVIA